jgi:hypothetical protein
MVWRDALKHAQKLADEGLETAIHVHARPDVMVERTTTVRVRKASIQNLDAFLADARKDGLTHTRLRLEADEYFELS